MSQEYDFDADERRYEEEQDREAERYFSPFKQEVCIRRPCTQCPIQQKVYIQYNNELTTTILERIATHTAEHGNLNAKSGRHLTHVWSVEIKGIYAEIHDWAGRHTGIVFNYTQ